MDHLNTFYKRPTHNSPSRQQHTKHLTNKSTTIITKRKLRHNNTPPSPRSTPTPHNLHLQRRYYTPHLPTQQHYARPPTLRPHPHITPSMAIEPPRKPSPVNSPCQHSNQPTSTNQRTPTQSTSPPVHTSFLVWTRPPPPSPRPLPPSRSHPPLHPPYAPGHTKCTTPTSPTSDILPPPTPLYPYTPRHKKTDPTINKDTSQHTPSPPSVHPHNCAPHTPFTPLEKPHIPQPIVPFPRHLPLSNAPLHPPQLSPTRSSPTPHPPPRHHLRS